MASLLGGEYCIESLRRDVSDLQAILDEVHSRVGQVKYQSWKFPDKASCDVDITRLLGRCQFNKEDEEESQMSHVMLYDVVIDRLVYLLQSFICFNEILLNVGNSSSQTSPSPASRKGKSIKSMSVGLTVKKCWGRITQIASLLQKLAKEVNAKPINALLDDKSSPIKSSNTTIESLDSETISHKKVSDDKDVSRDVRSISCQTHETAYTNCEICCRTQNCLSEVGRSIVDLCKSQNLPTVLDDYQTRYNDSVPMSVADLVRWGKHQSKDLSRISRHMASLVNQVTPLKADLATFKKSEQKVTTQLQQSQSVYERKEDELKEEFRRREYKLKEVEKDLKKKLSTMESIRTGMQEEMEKLTWKISDLKDELLQKHRDHLSQENALSQFKEEAMEGQQYKQDALKFKSELLRVNSELDETKQLVNRDRQLYERELTKNENMLQHEKILQEKQRNLLSRMETINEECEKMREQILNLEDERDVALLKFEEQMKNRRQSEPGKKNQILSTVHTSEVESLQQSLESLKEQNNNLILNVNEYVERERLLVAYPDLNQNSTSSPMVDGSGDVVTDMKKQVEANEIRMQILEKENDALIKTLERMNISTDFKSQVQSSRSTLDSTARSELYSAAMNESIYEPEQPIQLWKTTDIMTEQEENSPEADWYRRHQKSKSPPALSPKWQSSQTKPPSRRQKSSMSLQNRSNRRQDVPDFNGVHVDGGSPSFSGTSLEAYKKIKQQQHTTSAQNVRSSFTVGSGKRPKSGRPSSAKSALFKPWT